MPRPARRRAELAERPVIRADDLEAAGPRPVLEAQLRKAAESAREPAPHSSRAAAPPTLAERLLLIARRLRLRLAGPRQALDRPRRSPGAAGLLRSWCSSAMTPISRKALGCPRARGRGAPGRQSCSPFCASRWLPLPPTASRSRRAATASGLAIVAVASGRAGRTVARTNIVASWGRTGWLHPD